VHSTCQSAPRQKIAPASSQFSRARSRQRKRDAARLDQAMNLIEQLGDALDLINDDITLVVVWDESI
jgi:hypothetical protein